MQMRLCYLSKLFGTDWATRFEWLELFGSTTVSLTTTMFILLVFLFFLRLFSLFLFIFALFSTIHQILDGWIERDWRNFLCL